MLNTLLKYGDTEEVRKEQVISDFTEPPFYSLLRDVPYLKIVKHGETMDVHPDRKDKLWLNMFVIAEGGLDFARQVYNH